MGEEKSEVVDDGLYFPLDANGHIKEGMRETLVYIRRAASGLGWQNVMYSLNGSFSLHLWVESSSDLDPCMVEILDHL